MIAQDFLLQSYDYALPKALIASYPASPKESAKLLVYDRTKDSLIHSDFYHIFDFIPPKALIVLNDTKVIKARIHSKKESGGSVEILFHHQISDGLYLVQMKGKVQAGMVLSLKNGYMCQIKALQEGGYRHVIFLKDNRALGLSEVLEMLERYGQMPIPPYIKRPSSELDSSEYQSVFAKNYGAIAAPTASLHFSTTGLERLKKEFQHCFLTLHVGAGTFAGVEVADIREHQIHTETLCIPTQTMQALDGAREILCVGTTALRSVEYYKRLPPRTKQEDLFALCDIFLHLGNPVLHTQHLLTNFHLPKSTLIMLVASMVGLEKCKELYGIAIKNSYRFYSYGDGMLIL
ncbi:tRNA preQ1(34) S-adenosylmethionine ribosyltransferase-isomerase QueA [Helicobacter sp. 12S02634-8]|uniref:tRNA preQ1(34) S-adenosylmethionine ribosyltransferase-isomerase QueA n=1 Tax=Helicobacter sp. 12S02634-8 TaxID=1476199 RepID=UPI000BA6BD65|nr:tRNA preQ1(34) S-adenosylmethionine ribosyltransferase-isomerase QueA [Helicobacter sp. 12S02634-8]PAF48139.1 tRNA preQ1(34) S-adenosylmethionine ribosyltransferase-isomerase QueA [Helicobacter sp. 12S02634-8]